MVFNGIKHRSNIFKRRKVMKKRLVSLLLCGALAFSLTACGGGGDMSPAATPEPAADTAAAEDTAAEAAAEDTAADASADTSADASADTAAAGTTITVMASQDWVEDSEQELGKKVEGQTGIHVDYQIVPADQYQDLLLTRLNSGEGPDIWGAQSGFALKTTYNVEQNAVDLSEGSFFIEDLKGISVNDSKHGDLGTVKDVYKSGPQYIVTIQRTGKQDLLVPFVTDIFNDIRPEDGVIDCTLPEGLYELYDV
jgi:ribosomal 30S subunit maturation factor RimM